MCKPTILRSRNYWRYELAWGYMAASRLNRFPLIPQCRTHDSAQHLNKFKCQYGNCVLLCMSFPSVYVSVCGLQNMDQLHYNYTYAHPQHKPRILLTTIGLTQSRNQQYQCYVVRTNNTHMGQSIICQMFRTANTHNNNNLPNWNRRLNNIILYLDVYYLLK